MKVTKQKIANLDKCYALAKLNYKGERYFLVAAEKINKCLLFDLNGQIRDTIWDEPGGVMSMVAVPGKDGQFLSTQKFYSPNDSKEAKIVVVTPISSNKWQVKTLVEQPFVHRFDIIKGEGGYYLIVCTLKSEHEYKDDWSHPGKILVAKLPSDLSSYNEENQLELQEIKVNMTKNHGYYKIVKNGQEKAVISCEEGIFLVTPPTYKNKEWSIDTLLEIPASDATLIDLDGDGQDELFVLSPFHGDTISIYKKQKENYELIYKHKERLDFLHAIYAGYIVNKPRVIVGNRRDEKKLISFTYEDGKYTTQILDQGYGAANIMAYTDKGKEYLIAANRETNEVAMYRLEE